MKKLLGFAYITIKENVRRRSFYGVALAYFLSLLFARVVTDFSLQDLTKFLIDFSYSFLTFFLIVSTLFITTDTMSKDMEKKAVYTILSKGISREYYVLGRAFSFFVFTFLLTLVLGTMFLISAKGFNISIPTAYKKDILIAPGLIVLIVLWAKLFSLSTIVLFLSSFMRTFFLVFLASVVIYTSGSSIESLYYFITFNEDKVSPLVVYSIKLLFYILPNFSTLGPDVILGTEKLNGESILVDLMKSLTYSGFLVGLSMFVFRKRELL
ncbi:hypothetical protein [Hydrogenivirga sp.]